jgi:hypothetical protein
MLLLNCKRWWETSVLMIRFEKNLKMEYALQCGAAFWKAEKTGWRSRRENIADYQRDFLKDQFVAAMQSCGLDTFEAAYARNRQNAIDVILEHDILAQSVKALVTAKGEWQGTAMELLDQIGSTARITVPKVLSDQLRRLAPMLRSHGLGVEYESRTADRRGIRIFRVEQ